MRRFATALVLLLAVTAATAKPRIAIIIDDLGYHRHHGQAIADLPARRFPRARDSAKAVSST